VALRNGCPHAELLQRAEDINWDKFGAIGRLGLTAGASAPEVLIEEIIDAFAARYEVSVETVSAVEESGIFFQLPRQVRSSGEAAE
jgi:4-hydroxy-3-methylbut-2-en-1-yl diphosphate reductase